MRVSTTADGMFATRSVGTASELSASATSNADPELQNARLSTLVTSKIYGSSKLQGSLSICWTSDTARSEIIWKGMSMSASRCKVCHRIRRTRRSQQSCDRLLLSQIPGRLKGSPGMSTTFNLIVLKESRVALKVVLDEPSILFCQGSNHSLLLCRSLRVPRKDA